ncbi:MAG: iron-containing redox enzyme family protein, partial [Solirubrobacteraceae bacterium]
MGIAARGELSAHVLEGLAAPPGTLRPNPAVGVGDPLGDDDLQLALYLCYELHYRGLPGVDEHWEWDPGLLGFRALLEASFEAALREAAPSVAPVAPDGVPAALRELAEQDAEPSLSRHLERRATREQFEEFVVHRSAYQLKEADPHTFALPRLTGGPKAA